MFFSFDVLQRKANEVYYKKRPNIYSDFKTFGSSEKIACANAIEFFSRMQENTDSELLVYEFGIGNGLFALNFLKHIKTLDKTGNLLQHLTYFLCDISKNLLQKAEPKLRDFNVHTVECDATSDLGFIKNADYIRSNEMYDDLAAKVFVRAEEGIKEVLYNRKLEKKYLECCDKKISGYMERMPIGYEIPVNLAAKKHLAACSGKLKEHGYIDIFDYGFSSSEISIYPKEIWNRSILRIFNKQMTIDVNFDYLSGTNNTIEPQKDYAEKVLGAKLYYVELKQLCYLTPHELETKRTQLKKYGYPSGFWKTGIEEQDEYKHLRHVKLS